MLPPPPSEPPPDGASKFVLDLSQGAEEAIRRLQARAATLAKKGQHVKVRLKFRGREIAYVPLAVLLAAEAATFLGGGGLLRLLVVNALGKTFLDVEFVNEADGVVEAGRAKLLEGELEAALAKFREAISMDAEHAAAHLNLGVALKLQGSREEALAAFDAAARFDPDGDHGREARRQAELLRPRNT